MKYFVLKNDEENAMPRIVNWYSVINPQRFVRENIKQLPRFVALEMKLDQDFVYTDIITSPFFMVSREAADIIHMYDPAIPYISAVLFDKEMQESIVYYMPLLEEAGRQEYKNRPLVRQKQDRRYQIIARMDMIESLLVRGAAGITLSEIKGAP